MPVLIISGGVIISIMLYLILVAFVIKPIYEENTPVYTIDYTGNAVHDPVLAKFCGTTIRTTVTALCTHDPNLISHFRTSVRLADIEDGTDGLKTVRGVHRKLLEYLRTQMLTKDQLQTFRLALFDIETELKYQLMLAKLDVNPHYSVAYYCEQVDQAIVKLLTN